MRAEVDHAPSGNALQAELHRAPQPVQGFAAVGVELGVLYQPAPTVEF
ncbi:MAG: hypothetical protein ACOC83_01440 [Gemmatimonadota bacterium]